MPNDLVFNNVVMGCFHNALDNAMLQASDMARKALESEDLGEDEMQPAPKLLEVVLQYCRGRVDQYLPLYMQASIWLFMDLSTHRILFIVLCMLCSWSHSMLIFHTCQHSTAFTSAPN